MDLYITNTTDAQMLAQLRNLNATMNDAQRQVASGKRVQVPSDSPADVQTIVQNLTDLSRVQQSRANLSKLNSEVGMASAVLESAANLMDSARSIGAQGASSTTGASTLTLLAAQVQDIEMQMAGISASVNAGRYLFSGDADTTAPYSIDFSIVPPSVPATSPPTAPFASTTVPIPQATRMGLDSMGNTFPIAMTAKDIFDNTAAGQSVLQSLEDLRLGLLAGNLGEINTANADLATSATHLGSVQTFYGTAESTISSALDLASKSELTLQTQQSDLTSADMARAITVEQTAQTQQQALLSMRAKMPRGSLFDLLG